MDKLNKTLVLGCVADDFTGAGDMASFLAAGGLSTVLTSGVPAVKEIPLGTQAIVIALKSRTQETSAAIKDSLKAFRWLRTRGAGSLFFKYCSTFDSTPQGNIGPVTDAMLDELDLPYTILCPALPVNGRTVRDGVLYVNGVPLAESHMKNHPLTPMWESEVPLLMAPQSRYPCFTVTLELLENPELLERFLMSCWEQHPRFTLSVDCYLPGHDELILESFGHRPFLTGGSGLAESFARRHSEGTAAYAQAKPSSHQRGRVLLAGSCSDATREQVRLYQEAGKQAVELNPAHLTQGEKRLSALFQLLEEQPNEDILFYSTGSGGSMAGTGNREQDAAMLEQTMAALAKRAVELGYTRLVVAGGETSGAVTQALRYCAFSIGPSAAPGVPVLVPTGAQEVQLVLKSGNFGSPDFLLTTLSQA